MLRRVTLLLSVLGLAALLTPGALAAQNVIHYQFTDFEESSMPLDELADCVGYDGTVHEARTYDVRVTEFVSGPQAGRVHLTGFVHGDFTITPDDPDKGPVYEGSYREKVTFIGTSFDYPLVFSFSLPASATSSDGSTLMFLLHGHGVIDPDGDERVMVFKFHCIQPGT
jgi:hypothetical protein